MVLPQTPPQFSLISGSPRPAVSMASELLEKADAIVIGAGAGMSVGSGLPVYYGPDGRYSDESYAAANAELFVENPAGAAKGAQARLAQIRAASPHPGYEMLHRFAEGTRYGACVMTTNIDGLFVRAGFPENQVYEVHGNAAWSQCLSGCGAGVFPSPPPEMGVSACPQCGEVARPNVLMFADYEFDDTRRGAQWDALGAWFDSVPEDANVVVLEVGAGTTIPTVRRKCETLALTYGWPLVRVNPQEPECLTLTPPDVFVQVSEDAQTALTQMLGLCHG